MLLYPVSRPHGSIGFIVKGVTFAGATADRRGAALTGISDGKQGLLSVWVRLSGGNGTNMMISCNNGQNFYIRRNSSNNFAVEGSNGAIQNIGLTSATAYTSGVTWLHMLTSWNLATSAVHMYITNVSDLAGSPIIDDSNIVYSSSNWSQGDNNAGAQFLTGEQAEMFFHPTYLDLSVAGNRAKFISGGKPVDLGADGSLPLGLQPIIYFSVRANGVVGDWLTNRGTGGNFTLATGTQALSATSPSD